MPETEDSADHSAPPLICEVFAAADLRVRAGANLGDGFGDEDEPCAGDLYILADTATPRALQVTRAGDAPRVAPGSAVGEAGAPVAIRLSATLMSADGDRVEVLALTAGGLAFALPLSPLVAREGYTLISVNPPPASLRLADLLGAAFARGTRIALADGSLRMLDNRPPLSARNRPPPDLCDHFAPRRRQDHADRKVPAVRRRDPDGRAGARQGRGAAHAVGLHEDGAGPRHFGFGLAMSFDYRQYRFNLVDTPGHSDFSEDTYRTLTAVDAAIMVIDGAKGVESQTRKLFEVCRLRDLPILTFCNKMDRESRDTFEIIDEIQENLAIDVTPASPGPSGWGANSWAPMTCCMTGWRSWTAPTATGWRNRSDQRAGRPETGRTRARGPAEEVPRRD
jgi:hypothetical protein